MEDNCKFVYVEPDKVAAAVKDVAQHITRLQDGNAGQVNFDGIAKFSCCVGWTVHNFQKCITLQVFSQAEWYDEVIIQPFFEIVKKRAFLNGLSDGV